MPKINSLFEGKTKTFVTHLTHLEVQELVQAEERRPSSTILLAGTDTLTPQKLVDDLLHPAFRAAYDVMLRDGSST